ncbi:MAG: MFS transporter [Bacteroidia bacterium]|nr:MFS transporter [Bacteroidia bacterium]
MKGISKNIFFTGLTSFLTDTSTKMVYSVMPMFLMSIGASKTSLALIEGIAESTAALVKTFSGFWSDKIGKNKPFMLIGYGLSSLIMPFYALVISPVHVLYLRFAERVGKGIRTAPRDSLIAGSVAKGDRGKAFGVQKAMDNMGAILGPILAFLLLLFIPNNYRIIFLLAGIPAIFGIFVLLFGVKEAKKDTSTPIVWSGLKSFPKRYYAFLAVIFVFTLGNSTDALLLVKANEIGVKIAFIPLVYLLTSVVSVALAVPMGILSDKVGKEKMLAVGYLLYAIVYFGFGWSSDVKFIMALFALYGVYSAMTDGTQKAFVSDLVDSDKKGTGLGIYNALIGLTLLPASLLAGMLYDKVNADVPFYFGGAMSLLAAIMLVVLILTDKRRLNRKAN